MLNIIKKIFKKKEKPKKVEEEVLILTEDKTFENEIKQNKETISHTKSDLKSGLGG